MRHLWMGLLALALASPVGAQDATEAGRAAGTALALERTVSPWMSGATGILAGALMGWTSKDQHNTREDVLVRGAGFGAGLGLIGLMLADVGSGAPEDAVDGTDSAYAEGFREGYAATTSGWKRRSAGIGAVTFAVSYIVAGLLAEDFDTYSLTLYSGRVMIR